MNKAGVTKGLLLLLLCGALVFAGLWLWERKDCSELEQLCVNSAHQAYSRFSDYRDTGSEYDYDYGVAELVSFCNSYKSLVTREKGSTDTDCLYLNQLLGELMAKPELTAEQKSMLVSITYELSQNISDTNTYDDIFDLYNQLTR